MKGDFGIGGNTSSLDVPFSDIIDNFELGGAGYFEALKGKWGFGLDGIWMKIGSSTKLQTPGPLLDRAELDLEYVHLKGLVHYRFFDNYQTKIDAYGGVSYVYVDTQLKLSGLIDIKTRDTEGWFDPVIGLRINHQFNDKWFAHAIGEVGGFGVSSNFNWETMALLGYSINDCWDLGLAYRATGIDYSKDGFIFDVTMSGPMLGVTYSW